MKKYIFLLTILFTLGIVVPSTGQGTGEFFTQADAFFKTYVREGKVMYAKIKANPSALKDLVGLADKISVSVENSDEYQSFWINGYNLMVIKAVVENYPLKSPLDVPGFFDKTTHSIGGLEITLNDIENKLLRAKFPGEARFHFVLVCAGLGCPPIINRAYMPRMLGQQLQQQTASALNDPKFIRIHKNKVMISQIFEWYTEDFTREGKSVAAFITQYRREKLPENAKLSYYPYDWTLNEIN